MFSVYPQCLDPTGNGTTLWWCDTLSIVIGIFVFVCFFVLIAAFVYIKVKEGREVKEIAFDTSKGSKVFDNPMETNIELIEIKKKQRNAAQKQKNKKSKENERIRKTRLSFNLALQNKNVDDTGGGGGVAEKIEASDDDVEIFVDENTGKRYSYNSQTKQSIWLE